MRRLRGSRDQLYRRRAGARCLTDLGIRSGLRQVAVESHGANGHPTSRVVVPNAIARHQPASRVEKLLLPPSLQVCRWADKAGERWCRHEHVHLPPWVDGLHQAGTIHVQGGCPATRGLLLFQVPRHRVEKLCCWSRLRWIQQEVHHHSPDRPGCLCTKLSTRGAAAAEASLSSESLALFEDLCPVRDQSSGRTLRGPQHLVAGLDECLPFRFKAIALGGG
mmetsp:Transcript_46191/g.107905  ORF Transcript_46191/g.107905 Transcript_46191/m.107905 type:complete len:221 (-) Transcript_46191:1871-2533(-)